MKLHADQHTAGHFVTAYGVDQVTISGREFRRSLLLMPERIDAEWGPEQYDALNEQHFAGLVDWRGDVLLLGTGMRQRFPAMSLLRPLIEAGRSIEIMDTPAACRTYNILAAEGRVVAAALIIESCTG